MYSVLYRVGVNKNNFHFQRSHRFPQHLKHKHVPITETVTIMSISK